jgi:hypothetical protein
MEKSNSSTPRKAAAARENGRKGGTKNPDISRWNAVQHGLTAKNLTIHEGRHLAEYEQFARMRSELLQDLASLGPLSVEDYVAVDKFVADAWRLVRAYRFELCETEKLDNGMLSPAMATLLRYITLANRQLAESFARVQEIRQRKEAAAAKLAAAATRDGRADEQTASEPAAVDTVSQTATMSAEPLDTAPTSSHLEGAGQGEPPAESPLQTTAASASPHPGDPAGDTPEEAVQSAAAAEAAQPAPSPAAVSSTAANEEEQKSESPGEG